MIHRNKNMTVIYMRLDLPLSKLFLLTFLKILSYTKSKLVPMPELKVDRLIGADIST